MTEELGQSIEQAARALRAEGAREVYVFGSAVTGASRPDSDVDMAVAGLPPAVFFRAMSKASDALGRSLDLIDLDEDTPFTRYLRDRGELLCVG